MRFAVDVVGLLLVATAVAGLSARVGLPAPLMLTVVGIGASFVPGVPEYRLEPELVLLGVLPPLLYATAIRTPLVDIRSNRRAIGLLSVGLVLATALAVAVVVRAMLPQVPFAAALALGAIVAPPDAVAATAVARRVGMPRRVVTILEGESLLNDATALVTLRTALLGVASVSALSLSGAGVAFVVAVVVGVGVGWGVALAVTPVRRAVDDPVLDTTLSLLVPFLAYLPAEELHGSGVLAVVVAGLLLGHRSPEIQSATSRVTERTIWRTVQFLLESTVFLLIGLQLRALLQDARAGDLADHRIVQVCAAVTVTVIVVRMVWVVPGTYLPRLLPGVRRAGPRPPGRHVVLVGWAGMRGVVTLAAAFTLPSGTPLREVLVIAAFAVVAITLLVQGASLPWVVRRLGVAGPDPTQDALQQALVLQRAVEAGQARLDEVMRAEDQEETVDYLRGWGQRRAQAAWERLGVTDENRETPAVTFRRLRVEMLAAERRVVVDVRRSGAVAHEVAEQVLHRLDQEEALLVGFSEPAPAPATTLVAPAGADLCAHLAAAAAVAVPRSTEGCPACLELGERSWVHLRMCLTCGNVGCCDSSPHRHAEAHYRSTGHPVMRSIELGEAWRWCYPDSRVG